jgi:hypothetical protein
MKLTERQLERAIYSLWDFQQALSALTFLLEDCDFEKGYSKVELRRFRCYETTLIISMARPFEQSRNGTTLALRAIGISLDELERNLVSSVTRLRRKIIAHSDEEEMHFRSGTFPVLDGTINFPELRFDETLHLKQEELMQLEVLLRKLVQGIGRFIFKLAQDEPNILERYKQPERLARKDSV